MWAPANCSPFWGAEGQTWRRSRSEASGTSAIPGASRPSSGASISPSRSTRGSSFRPRCVPYASHSRVATSKSQVPPPPSTQVAQSNYGYGGGPNGGINPLELSWDEQRFLAQLASDRKMVSDRARAHELSARASTGVRAGGVPSFVDVASPSKPVVTRGVRDAASAEFARPSSAATWHERERAAVRARGATSSTASPSSSRPR